MWLPRLLSLCRTVSSKSMTLRSSCLRPCKGSHRPLLAPCPDPLPLEEWSPNRSRVGTVAHNPLSHRRRRHRCHPQVLARPRHSSYSPTPCKVSSLEVSPVIWALAATSNRQESTTAHLRRLLSSHPQDCFSPWPTSRYYYRKRRPKLSYHPSHLPIFSHLILWPFCPYLIQKDILHPNL